MFSGIIRGRTLALSRGIPRIIVRDKLIFRPGENWKLDVARQHRHPNNDGNEERRTRDPNRLCPSSIRPSHLYCMNLSLKISRYPTLVFSSHVLIDFSGIKRARHRYGMQHKIIF